MRLDDVAFLLITNHTISRIVDMDSTPFNNHHHHSSDGVGMEDGTPPPSLPLFNYDEGQFIINMKFLNHVRETMSDVEELLTRQNILMMVVSYVILLAVVILMYFSYSLVKHLTHYVFSRREVQPMPTISFNCMNNSPPQFNASQATATSATTAAAAAGRLVGGGGRVLSQHHRSSINNNNW